MNSPLAPQFCFKHRAKADPNAVIAGCHYRFTLLTERLIRMEYSPSGEFEDRPSQTFWFRHQPVPEFQVQENEQRLNISTRFFHLTYEKDQPFSRASLSVKLTTDSISGSGIWRYGFHEHNNYRGTARTLDGVDGELVLERGLFSEEGYVIWDDQPKQVFDEGWLAARNPDNEDLYFFAYGNDFQAGIRDFYQVSGNTPMLPRYALGNWWSRYWRYDEAELRALVDNFAQRAIPLSVCILDMDWHLTDIPKQYGSGWTGYTWNQALFPQPKAFLDWLKARDIYSSLNLHPALGIRGHEQCYPDVAQMMGVDVSAQEPVEFDFTNPTFISAYFSKVHHPHEEMGVDFWWIDWQQGENTAIEGLDPLWLLNHFHFLDLGRKGEKRGFTFSRYAGLGSHRYPIGFSGDTCVTWQSLDFQPYFTANAAFAGYGWWSHDIGGHFQGEEEAQLYLRWVQFGVFSPIMRLHSSCNYYSKREPWRWDSETERIASEYMRLRHGLIPYLYSMAWINHQGGLPLVTPMSCRHPHMIGWGSERYRNQYYFGSELIVAPQTTPLDGELKRSVNTVSLPQGDWYDFFTGEHYRGGREYRLYSGLEHTPVFAKSGAIVPLSGHQGNSTVSPAQIQLKLFVGDGEFTLYEDDGVSNAYQQGAWVTTRLLTRRTSSGLELTIESPQGELSLLPNERSYLVEVVGYAGTSVQLQGAGPHQITLSLHQPLQYNPIQSVMTAVDGAQIPTADKALIGFVSEYQISHRGGILAMEGSLARKVSAISQLAISEKVKTMVIDLLLKHED